MCLIVFKCSSDQKKGQLHLTGSEHDPVLWGFWLRDERPLSILSDAAVGMDGLLQVGDHFLQHFMDALGEGHNNKTGVAGISSAG
jgi:hypothetical protein